MSEKINKTITLIVTTTASFLTPFMGASCNIALPSIGREFGMDAITLGWVPTAYLLSAAMFLVISGRLADIYGRRRVFLYGVAIYTLASLLIVFSKNIPAFFICRILQGIGGALLFGTAVAILTSVFAPDERGKALGINVAGVYIGLSLGPFLGGLLTQNMGWRSIFYLNFLLGCIILILVILVLKGEWAEARGERFDYLGSLIYAPSLFFIMRGFSLLPAKAGLLFLLIGCIMLFIFILWEMRCRAPVFNLNLFRKNTVFAYSNLAALINYSATNAIGFLLSLYLQYLRRFSPREAGIVLISQPVVMAAFSPLAGRLSDKIEPRIIASLGMALTTMGLILFGFIEANSAIFLIIINLIIVGFGFALFSSPNTNAVMGSIERRYYGVGSSILATMRLLGQMFSMGFVMLVLSIYMGATKIVPEYYPLFLKSTKISFYLFAVLCAFGVYASLKRGKRRGSSQCILGWFSDDFRE